MKKSSFSTFSRTRWFVVGALLVAGGCVAGCVDYKTDGSDISRNVVYGAAYSGSGVYTGWGYGGNPYYGPGYGYGGGAIIVTPSRP